MDRDSSLDAPASALRDAAPTKPRVAFLTFGCRVNQYDTQAMRNALGDDYEFVESAADVVVLNGCSVTGLAEKKARQALHRLRASAPRACIVLTGCLGEAVTRGMTPLSGADLAAGLAWRSRIRDVVAEAMAGRRGILLSAPPVAGLDVESSGPPVERVRAYLKVQDGCSAACSYCRAVKLRGASRSKSLEAACEEAERLVAAGVPELIVCGVNLAEYSAGGRSLAALLRRLLRIDGLRRLRLASLNVAGVTGDLLDAFAEDARLCRHFHIPLQSGDDGILRSMRRPYALGDYRAAADRVCRRLPDATLGTDLIVGFPGESEGAFRATCRAVEEMRFANLHVFRFSPRPGTEAVTLPDRVSESAKRRRAEELAAVWQPVRRGLLDARVGATEDVLVEERRDARWSGHSAGYFSVSFASADLLRVGEICSVRITKAAPDGLEGVHDTSERTD